jgi:thiosulfate/3-mercaptopyruvate sulfurtransferase
VRGGPLLMYTFLNSLKASRHPAGVYNAKTLIPFAPMKTLTYVLLLLSFAALADEEANPSQNEAAIAIASEATPALIVDTAFVAEAIQRGAILWDARIPEEFRKGHIPGAVNIGDPLRVLRSENSEDFIPQDLIEDIFGGVGLNPAQEIIVYAGKATPSAYFGLYALQFFGADNVRVYHGGIDDWKLAGRPISAQIIEKTPIKLTLTPRPEINIETSEVLNKLDRSEVQILDVRTQREFDGEDVRALRGGHIVGAINIPYERNFTGLPPRKPGAPPANSKDALALKPDTDLRALYALLDPDKETIVYCQSGSRASVTSAVLKDLGFKNVRLYDSSWLEYGNTLEAPAEDVKFFNVGLFSNRMNALMKRVDELEKELAALRENKK